MFEWWKRRQAKKVELAEKEKKMADALKSLERKEGDQINGHEVESIEKEITEGADEAIAALEAELNSDPGTGRQRQA